MKSDSRKKKYGMPALLAAVALIAALCVLVSCSPDSKPNGIIVTEEQEDNPTDSVVTEEPEEDLTPVVDYCGELFLLVGSSMEHIDGCISEDEQIASCEDGVITAVAEGKTRIVSGADSDLCRYWDLIVNDYQDVIAPIDRTLQLEASGSGCTWSSINSEIAAVDENGLLTPIAVGECVVTATDVDGRQYGWRVSVKRVAYLTIDDWPNDDSTIKILETLKKYDIKATFFLVRQRNFIEVYQRIIDEGHSIGNHTEYHDFDYIYASSDNFCKSVRRMDEWMMEMFGVTTKLLRFPGGYYGRTREQNEAYRKLTAEGYRVYDWTCSTGDTQYTDPREIFKAFKNTLNDDIEVVLMHHKNGTAEVLEEMILYLYEHDYVCLPLDETCPAFDFIKGWQE